MFKIAWWIILAIVIINIWLYLITKYIWWKEEKIEIKKYEKRKWWELKATEKRLEDKWEIETFCPKEWCGKVKELNDDKFVKWYIIWFCIFCLIGAIIVIICL